MATKCVFYGPGRFSKSICFGNSTELGDSACAVCATTHPESIRQEAPEEFDPKGGSQALLQALDAVIEEQQKVPHGYYPCVSRYREFQDRMQTPWVSLVVNARDLEFDYYNHRKKIYSAKNSYSCEAVKDRNTLCAVCANAMEKNSAKYIWGQYFTDAGVLKEPPELRALDSDGW